MQGHFAAAWGAINLVILVAWRLIGPRWFKERAGTAMIGLIVLSVINGALMLFIAPPYWGLNSRYTDSVSDGKTLFLVHEVGGRSHTGVVEPWDLGTGLRRTRKVPSIFAFDPLHIVMRVDERVWLTSGVAGLHARDLGTGELVISQADLAARSPLFTRPVALASSTGDALCFFTADGYPVRFSPRTLVAEQLEAGAGCASATLEAAQVPDALTLADQGARRSVMSAAHGARARALDPEHTWLLARWVERDHRALRIDEGTPSLLMTFVADGSHAPMIARVGIADGRAQWTHALGVDAVEDVALERVLVGDGRVVVITPSTIIALDAATGAERWSKPY